MYFSKIFFVKNYKSHYIHLTKPPNPTKNIFSLPIKVIHRYTKPMKAKSKLIPLKPNSCWTFKHPYGEVTMYLPHGSPDSITPEKALWLLKAAERALISGDTI